MQPNDRSSDIYLEAQARSGIDIDRLIIDLVKIKQEFFPQSKSLSDKETEYLCLSLSRYSQGQIAYYFYRRKIVSVRELEQWADLERSIGNLNSEMSLRVNKYLKMLMKIDERARKPSWKKIVDFLQQSERYNLSQRSSRETTKLSLIIEIDTTQPLSIGSIDRLNELLQQHGIANIKISEFLG
jgi:hypothetical protein